jgi:tripartite-type tricarboxylate transporter receptor subunit TctC
MRLWQAALVVGTLLASSTQPTSARAEFPDRPIRIVVPFGPGGLADIAMRHLGQKLTESTGQQVVIENRPSAGGVLAAAAVTSAAPDGYTLFVLSSGIAISRSVMKTLPFDPVVAFTPVSTVAFFDLLLLVKGNSPLRTVADALASARAAPDKFNIGTINRGSTQNTTAELLRSVTGVKMAIVPFRSTGEVATALLRGDVTIAVESYAALKAQIDEGALRAIAGTGEARSALLANVPTLRESGIAAEVVGWNALVAPAGTPAEVVATLNRYVRAVVESPEFRQRMRELGTEARSSTPQELGARLKADIEKWAIVVKQAGIEPQ